MDAVVSESIKPYYDQGGVTIYHGDCREILPQLGRFDLLLTDPPYLLPGMKGAGCFGGRKALTGTKGFTDMGFDPSILASCDNWFCFCSRHNLRELIDCAANGKWAVLQWCKPNPVPTCNRTYLSDVEYCVHKWSPGRLFGQMKDKSLFFVHPCGQKESSHPNEKPLALIRKLVKLGTQEGDLIVDPFAGSGTSGVAAKREGRLSILIETDERYCEIAAKRVSQSMLF